MRNIAYLLNVKRKGDDRVEKKIGSNNFYVSKRTTWFPNISNFYNRFPYQLTSKFLRNIKL